MFCQDDKKEFFPVYFIRKRVKIRKELEAADRQRAPSRSPVRFSNVCTAHGANSHTFGGFTPTHGSFSTPPPPKTSPMESHKNPRTDW